MCRIISIVFVIPMILSVTGNVWASETMIVGVENIRYYPHYSYEHGIYKGFAKKLIDAFSQKNKYTLKYKALPLNRLFLSFTEGAVDFKYPSSPFWMTDEKKEFQIFYSNPVVQYIDGVMVLPERKGLPIEKLQTLGTIQGFTPWSYLGLIKSQKIALKEIDTMETLLQMTMDGRIDGAYVNVSVALYYLKKNMKNTGAIVFDQDLPHEKDFYMLSSIKRPDIIKLFNEFLVDNRKMVDKLKLEYEVGELVLDEKKDETRGKEKKVVVEKPKEGKKIHGGNKVEPREKETRVKATQVIEMRVIKPRVIEPRIKETRVKEMRVKETKIKEPQIKDTEGKETRVKETRIKETRAKESQIKETKAKDTRVKQTVAKETKKRALLIEGSRGSNVQYLQKCLKTKKYYTGPLDGQFTPELVKIVKKFQKENKLVSDGLVGPLTWAVLEK